MAVSSAVYCPHSVATSISRSTSTKTAKGPPGVTRRRQSDGMRRNFQRRWWFWRGVPRADKGQQRPGGGWRRGGESEARGMKQPPPRWTRKRNRLPCSGCLLLFITIPPLEEGGQNIPRFKNPFCTGSRTEIRCLRVFSWLHHALTSQLPDRG